MTHNSYAVGGELVNSKRYQPDCNGKSFASPLKELNQKTVLTEVSEENQNDSYRQHTKYNDQVDRYYSTYDLGILLQNEESCLEGAIDSKQDVDYYTFSYQQRGFYTKMGTSSDIIIKLECPKGSNYNLTVYDMYGNQVGTAKDNGNGSKELKLPNWGFASTQYTIRVEGTGGEIEKEMPYRIKVKEIKNQDAIKPKNEEAYQEQLERLHQEQLNALPKEEQYSGTATVEELLAKLEKGEPLTRQEKTYVKLLANLADYEKAEAKNYIQNKLYSDIKEKMKEEGMNLPKEQWSIEMDVSGNLSVKGEMSEEMREQLETMLQDSFGDDLWNSYMRAADNSYIQYEVLNGYHETDRFIRNATEGEYSYEDVTVDEKGQIGGLPDKLCRLLNSQDANAKYEELRDQIYMLEDYKNTYGMKAIKEFQAGYQITDAGLAIVEAHSQP